MAGSSSRAHYQQARDLNERFSSGHTHTPPSRSPSSGSEPDDKSGLEMWYVAPTPMHQLEKNMLESSSSSEDVGSPAPNHVERVIVVGIRHGYH
jgi:hypothetical protein